MSEIMESIYDTVKYANAIGNAEYLEEMVNRGSTAYQQYLNRRQRRKARNEFYSADSSSFLPSNIASDLRDSLNINGPLQVVQQSRFEQIRTMSHSSGQPFGQSGQYFDDYYSYLQRNNQMNQLTLNNTQMSQQLHRYHSTSNSNYIQQQMRSMTNRPNRFGASSNMSPWHYNGYYPF